MPCRLCKNARSAVPKETTGDAQGCDTHPYWWSCQTDCPQSIFGIIHYNIGDLAVCFWGYIIDVVTWAASTGCYDLSSYLRNDPDWQIRLVGYMLYPGCFLIDHWVLALAVLIIWFIAPELNLFLTLGSDVVDLF